MLTEEADSLTERLTEEQTPSLSASLRRTEHLTEKQKAPSEVQSGVSLSSLSAPLRAVHLGAPLCTWCADPS